MKLNLKYLNLGFGILLSALFLGSCNDDDTNFVTNAGLKPVVTLVADDSYTIAEGDSIALTLTLDHPIAYPVQVKIDLINENGEQIMANSDYSIDGALSSVSDGFGVDGYYVTVPANTTSYTFYFHASKDDAFEVNETYMFEASITGTLTGVIDDASSRFSVTILPVVQDELRLTFDWNADVKMTDSAGAVEETTLCDLGYDVDFILYDADFNQVDNFDSQTADCPEHLNFNFTDFADGTYFITAYLWDDAGVVDQNMTPEVSFPIRVSYVRGGSETLGDDGGTFVRNGFTSATTPGTEIYVMTVVIANGTYTILDDATTIASGRQAFAGKAKHIAHKK